MKPEQIEEIEKGLIELQTPSQIMIYWNSLKPHLSMLGDVRKDLFDIISESGIQDSYVEGLIEKILSKFTLKYK